MEKNEEELFRSGDFEVIDVGRNVGHTENGPYRLVIAHQIVMATSDLGFANLVASALARMVPAGCSRPLDVALDGLRDLVEARELLAGIVEREARVHGKMSEAMRRAAMRMRGNGYNIGDTNV